MERAQRGNAPAIASADWAYECAQSKAHAYIKLIVHTLRILISSSDPDTEVSDDDLSRLTSLSPKTVQRYRMLAEREGWIEYRAGRGRSKVSTYRIAVPKETLNQLASRLDALTKNQSVRPPLASENRSHSPTASPTTRENRSASPTTRENSKKEIPPTPPKEKNNITTLDWRARENLDLLETKLLDAANGAAADPAIAPNILVLSEPIKWLEGGCDLELDILPTIRARAHKLRAGSVKNWSYFTDAIADAKAARLAPMPEGRAPPGGQAHWRDEERERQRQLREIFDKARVQHG